MMDKNEIEVDLHSIEAVLIGGVWLEARVDADASVQVAYVGPVVFTSNEYDADGNASNTTRQVPG
jgi:hypothetical protein